ARPDAVVREEQLTIRAEQLEQYSEVTEEDVRAALRMRVEPERMVARVQIDGHYAGEIELDEMRAMITDEPVYVYDPADVRDPVSRASAPLSRSRLGRGPDVGVDKPRQANQLGSFGDFYGEKKI